MGWRRLSGLTYYKGKDEHCDELLWKDGAGWLAEEEQLGGQLHCRPVIYICTGDLLTQQKQQSAIQGLGILYMF